MQFGWTLGEQTGMTPHVFNLEGLRKIKFRKNMVAKCHEGTI